MSGENASKGALAVNRASAQLPLRGGGEGPELLSAASEDMRAPAGAWGPGPRPEEQQKAGDRVATKSAHHHPMEHERPDPCSLLHVNVSFNPHGSKGAVLSVSSPFQR